MSEGAGGVEVAKPLFLHQLYEHYCAGPPETAEWAKSYNCGYNF